MRAHTRTAGGASPKCAGTSIFFSKVDSRHCLSFFVSPLAWSPLCILTPSPTPFLLCSLYLSSSPPPPPPRLSPGVDQWLVGLLQLGPCSHGLHVLFQLHREPDPDRDWPLPVHHHRGGRPGHLWHPVLLRPGGQLGHPGGSDLQHHRRVSHVHHVHRARLGRGRVSCGGHCAGGQSGGRYLGPWRAPAALRGVGAGCECHLWVPVRRYPGHVHGHWVLPRRGQ
jgi:hypothetical protein